MLGEITLAHQQSFQVFIKYRHEESLTQDTLQPLGEHLTELTAAVQEQVNILTKDTLGEYLNTKPGFSKIAQEHLTMILMENI